MNLCVRRSAVLALPAVAATILGAQQQAATPDKLVFRSTARLVQVSVLAHDRSGKPVDDLTQADFTITDRGKPQEIRLFQMNRVQPAPPGPADSAAPAVPQRTFSNRPIAANGASAANATVILLDGLNTSTADQLWARGQVVRFLATQLKPEDRVSLVLLSGSRLKVLQDFTSDSRRLLHALERWHGQESPEFSGSQDPDDASSGFGNLDQTLGIASSAMQDFYTTRRVENTLASLEAIANHMGYLTGRKSIVWISSGFPLHIGMDNWNIDSPSDRRVFTEELQRTVRALNQANVAVYPVDARGLMTDPRFRADRSGPALRPGVIGPPRMAVGPNDAMLELADRTGGRAFHSTNDVQRAVRAAIDDSALTYTLAYYSSLEPDDRFHPIKIAVNRPGVRLQYRKGYFAFTQHQASDKGKRQALREAAWSPLMSAGIGAGLRLDPMPDHKLGVSLVIEPYDLGFTNSQVNGETRWNAAVDILIVQRDRSGKTLKELDRQVSLALKRENFIQTLKTGLRMASTLELAPGVEELRVVMLDETSGNLGTLIAPLQDLLAASPPPPPAVR